MGVFAFHLISLLKTVWETDYGDPSRKLVMLCLADMANSSGICWPAVETICNRCSLSRRPVQRHLAALKAAGCITITSQCRDGKSASNHYQIMPNRCGVHAMGGAASTPHRITNRTEDPKSTLLPDPRGLLTRPTQLPIHLRGRRRE